MIYLPGEEIIWVMAAGFLGGIIRGLVGISKEIRSSPSEKKNIRKDYIATTLLSAGGMGILVGMFIVKDIKFALLAGYTGSDFLENVFKAKMRKKTW
ncbi:MAG: hypothetical protein ABEK36_01650 [Candidatus Aenigmatarchaeota archaeon]